MCEVAVFPPLLQRLEGLSVVHLALNRSHVLFFFILRTDSCCGFIEILAKVVPLWCAASSVVSLSSFQDADAVDGGALVESCA